MAQHLYVATIQVLVRAESDAHASDGISETFRPLTNEFWLDWQYRKRDDATYMGPELYRGGLHFEHEPPLATAEQVADEATRLYHAAQTSVVYERSGDISQDLRKLRDAVNALRARAGLGPSPLPVLESEQADDDDEHEIPGMDRDPALKAVLDAVTAFANEPDHDLHAQAAQQALRYLAACWHEHYHCGGVLPDVERDIPAVIAILRHVQDCICTDSLARIGEYPL